ncbi:MAG: MFS transporter [Candidatus Dadabacteria bacterium]|nr:MFS transporter [Candidatus Dadabacteria bacterium]
MKPYGHDEENQNEIYKDIGWNAKDAFKTKPFWILYLTFFLGFNTFLIVIINLYNYCVDSGISPIVAAGAPAAIGVGSILGRLFFSGVMANILNKVRILFICYFLQACSIIIILIFSKTLALYLFGFLFGFFYSGWVPMFPIILGDFFGLKSLGKIFGLIGTGFSLAAITGPLIAGLFYDITDSYFLPFLFATIVCYLTAFITFLINKPREIVS